MAITHFETSEAFDEAKKGDAPLVVDFYAKWCAPCKLIRPVFEKWSDSADYTGVKFGAVDVDALGEVANNEDVEGMPTFKFYHRGELMKTVVGASERELMKELENLKQRVPKKQ